MSVYYRYNIRLLMCALCCNTPAEHDCCCVQGQWLYPASQRGGCSGCDSQQSRGGAERSRIHCTIVCQKEKTSHRKNSGNQTCERPQRYVGNLKHLFHKDRIETVLVECQVFF